MTTKVKLDRRANDRQTPPQFKTITCEGEISIRLRTHGTNGDTAVCKDCGRRVPINSDHTRKVRL